MRDHTKLRAFDLADDLAVKTYMITKNFPKEEIYGLTSQMRRAAVSVASNIVEGCARESQLEYHRFLEMAFGSLRELSYQFSLAIRLGFMKEQENIAKNFKSKSNEAQKVLGSLIRSMR
jgi:four helix bundle protein